MLIKNYSTFLNRNRELESQVIKLTLNVEKLLQQINVVGQKIPIYLDLKKGIDKCTSCKNKPYLLLYYFSLNDCSSCLAEEISELNKIVFDNKNWAFSIVGLVDKKDASNIEAMRQNLNIRFPIISIDSMEIKLNQFPIKTPFILCADMKTRKIQYAFSKSEISYSSSEFLANIKRLYF